MIRVEIAATHIIIQASLKGTQYKPGRDETYFTRKSSMVINPMGYDFR